MKYQHIVKQQCGVVDVENNARLCKKIFRINLHYPNKKEHPHVKSAKHM